MRQDLKIIVGLSTQEYIRKADFLPYFLGLEKPENTLITTVHGQSPAEARNIIAQQAIDHNCTHAFFIDDDMAVPPDTLMRLIQHDQDVITALYLLRGYPHFPAAFDIAFGNGFNKSLFLTSEISGLIPITNCGLGCVLVKTEVFRTLEKPWVRLGEIVKDGWCDDVGFFNRVREAGFKLFCDTDVRVGHMTNMLVWPNKVGDRWFTEYKSEKGNIMIPQVVPSVAETESQTNSLSVVS